MRIKVSSQKSLKTIAHPLYLVSLSFTSLLPDQTTKTNTESFLGDKIDFASVSWKTVVVCYDWHTHFFTSNGVFSTQRQCYLTFSWIGLQMLFRYCLIHISIIILRHILHLLYLSRLRSIYVASIKPFFIFIFIFID